MDSAPSNPIHHFPSFMFFERKKLWPLEWRTQAVVTQTRPGPRASMEATSSRVCLVERSLPPTFGMLLEVRLSAQTMTTTLGSQGVGGGRERLTAAARLVTAVFDLRRNNLSMNLIQNESSRVLSLRSGNR